MISHGFLLILPQNFARFMPFLLSIGLEGLHFLPFLENAVNAKTEKSDGQEKSRNSYGKVLSQATVIFVC